MAPPVFWVIGEPHEKHEIKKVLNPQKTKRVLGFYGKSLILDLVECVVIMVKYRVFFFTGPPPKKLKYGKQRLGEVRCI